MVHGNRSGSAGSSKAPFQDASATSDNALRPWATNRATDHKVSRRSMHAYNIYIDIYIYI
jgi:hypothetical protein